MTEFCPKHLRETHSCSTLGKESGKDCRSVNEPLAGISSIVEIVVENEIAA